MMLLFLLALQGIGAGLAQTGQEPYRLSTQATAVLVPAEVRGRGGELVWGLTAEQFEVEDNGVRQQVRLEEDPGGRGLSLAVVVQCSGAAASELRKLSGLAAMVEGVTGGAPHQVAVVTYGTEPSEIGDFTSDDAKVRATLRGIAPCEGDAPTLDAVRYATELLAARQDGNRHAILLVSETRDHGSQAKAEEVIEALGRTNTVVNAVSFSPGRNLFLHELRHGSEGSGPDLLPLLLMAVNGLRKNAPAELAALSGGEYANFTTAKGFDAALGRVANQIHNYYLLSFQPSAEVAAGFHALTVRVPGLPGAVVRSRTGYWAEGAKGAAPRVK